MKGKSHFLKRQPNSSNDQWSIKYLEEKKEIILRSSSLKEVIEFLKSKIEELERMQREHDENLDKLSNLYTLGIIDENDNLNSNKIEW